MLAVVLLAALAAPPDEGRVVERIVAVVRNPAGAAQRPITLTRLTGEARIALVGQGALEAATAPLDAAALRAGLRWLVDQWLVADEAARLQVDEVPRQDVQVALERFRARFPGAAAYQAFLASADLSESEVGVALARDLRVQRYLDSRLGRASRARDEEVAARLSSQGTTLESPEATASARAHLSAEKLRGQVRQFLADLRGRADVRVLVPELRGEGAR